MQEGERTEVEALVVSHVVRGLRRREYSIRCTSQTEGWIAGRLLTKVAPRNRRPETSAMHRPVDL